MQTLLGSVRSFEGNSGLQFIEVRVLDNVEDMTTPKVLAASSRTIHIRCVTLGKMLIKY